MAPKPRVCYALRSDRLEIFGRPNAPWHPRTLAGLSSAYTLGNVLVDYKRIAIWHSLPTSGGSVV